MGGARVVPASCPLPQRPRSGSLETMALFSLLKQPPPGARNSHGPGGAPRDPLAPAPVTLPYVPDSGHLCLCQGWRVQAGRDDRTA